MWSPSAGTDACIANALGTSGIDRQNGAATFGPGVGETEGLRKAALIQVFAVQTVHQPSGLIWPSTTAHVFDAAMKCWQSAHFFPSFGCA